jgi:hypothetical protein
MKKQWRIETSIVEQGNIFFFYKPRKAVRSVHGFSDVGRFYITLKPEDSERLRFIMLGMKRMPSLDDAERGWGIVTKVGGRGFKSAENAKRAVTSGKARPAGEGVYALVRHRSHTHLVYYLELPHKLGDVQKTLHINREGNYVVSFRSAHKDPQEQLDREGSTLFMIGVKASLRRMGLNVERNKETELAADIFNSLRMNKQLHPIKPLMRGLWE